MKKNSRKKGFSLIELIVVIAVIAAIAAVIVPSVGNFSNAAKVAADKKNVSAWNQTYLNLLAGGDDTTWTGGKPAAIEDVWTLADKEVSSVGGSIIMNSTSVTFSAPGFKVAGGGVPTFDAATGLSFPATNGY